MSPGDIDSKVVAQRVFWISQMVDSLKDLQLEEKGSFLADRHKVAAAESYLRRALEALFDIGRHILAKRFAYPATEYKDIAKGLSDKGIVVEKEAESMRKMAGYRNRMVHFYHEITPEELHEICLYHVNEIKFLADKLVQWAKEHQDRAIT
jgi:uncharacterized protein YutE (UPF0331/DUF86 family)